MLPVRFFLEAVGADLMGSREAIRSCASSISSSDMLLLICSMTVEVSLPEPLGDSTADDGPESLPVVLTSSESRPFMATSCG